MHPKAGMQILTATEMGETDKRSSEQGVPVAMLMENAGAAVAHFVQRHFAGQGPVVALCGTGNNGGDGMVAARLLGAQGRPTKIVVLGKADKAKDAAAGALHAA